MCCPAGTSLLPAMALFGSTATKDSLYEYTVKDAGEHIISVCCISNTFDPTLFKAAKKPTSCAHVVSSVSFQSCAVCFKYRSTVCADGRDVKLAQYKVSEERQYGCSMLLLCL